jgi:osmotically-inducible protein OsmY
MHKYLIVLLIPIFLSSCGWLVGAGAATAGYIAAQDRTTGRVIDDTAIWSKLKSKLSEDSAKRFAHVNIKVNEARVLLAGHVHTRQARLDCTKLVWDIEGVKEVINDIQISENNNNTLGNYSRDTWITTKIKSKLLVADQVKSANYSIDTIDGVVYIMGIAESKAEIERVCDVARKQLHVKKVISHIRLKEDFLRRQE